MLRTNFQSLKIDAMKEPYRIDYRHTDAEPPHGHDYLWPPILDLLQKHEAKRVFDLGCGNGSFVRKMASLGMDVTGVDPSEEGVQRAVAANAGLKIEPGSAYEPLAEKYGQFDAVVSQEVIGHVYFPDKFARCARELVKPGGIAIISTPYHGYWKNLLIALTGKWDAHHTALWRHGIIKFWSPATLTELFAKEGFERLECLRVGRWAPLAKSMILVFRAPK
jgi:2-polyprenyl-3-methyl-5-hydroxy-6-metoxy-1,4-benzoquinol methylase